MSIWTDAEIDAGDLAELVNGTGFVTTRYGDNPKRSWQQLQDEFDETQAGEYVAISVAAADRAESEADRAETAADNAFINADLYPTAQDGIDNTLVNEQFQVLASSGNEYIRFLHDIGDVAVELGRYPSANIISQTVDNNVLDETPSSNAVYDAINNAASDFILMDNDPTSGYQMSGEVSGTDFIYTWGGTIVILNTTRNDGFYYTLAPSSLTLPNRGIAYLLKSELQALGEGDQATIHVGTWLSDPDTQSTDAIILAARNRSPELKDQSGLFKDILLGYKVNNLQIVNSVSCLSNSTSIPVGDIIVTSNGADLTITWSHSVFLVSNGADDNYNFILNDDETEKTISLVGINATTAYILRSDLTGTGGVLNVYYCRWNDEVLKDDDVVILINRNKGGTLSACDGVLADYFNNIINSNNIAINSNTINGVGNLNGISELNMFDRGNAAKSYETKKVGIITAGQSNTEGRVPLDSQPPSWYSPSTPDLPNTNYWDDTTSSWIPWTVPDLWAYDTEVYKQISEHLNDEIYIIKRTQGGTAISEKASATRNCWQPIDELVPSGYVSLTLSFEQYIRNALATAEANNFNIEVFLWHQGEGDDFNLETQNDYYVNFKNVIAYVRGVLNNPKLPIVFGTLSHASAQYSPIVEAAQFQVASEDDHAYVVNMENGTLLDLYHFDGTSSESLGAQMSTIIKSSIL